MIICKSHAFSNLLSVFRLAFSKIPFIYFYKLFPCFWVAWFSPRQNSFISYFLRSINRYKNKSWNFFQLQNLAGISYSVYYVIFFKVCFLNYPFYPCSVPLVFSYKISQILQTFPCNWDIYFCRFFPYNPRNCRVFKSFCFQIFRNLLFSRGNSSSQTY